MAEENTTHPNAYRAEAAEKRTQAVQLNAQADELEAQANQLEGKKANGSSTPAEEPKGSDEAPKDKKLFTKK